MKLKKLIINALLLAIGFILHQITPPIFMGMKPDFSLIMLFIAIVISDDYKVSLITGIAAGVLSAASTTFPGGQIPNVIDKIITTNIIYFIHTFMLSKLNDQIKIIIMSVLGTLLSGAIFLGSALILVGIPAPFTVLFTTVVLPCTVINVVAAILIYNAVSRALKYSY